MEPMNNLFTLIHDFLMISLPKERKSSPNTIRSYKKALELLLDFVKDRKHIPLNKLTLDCPLFCSTVDVNQPTQLQTLPQ